MVSALFSGSSGPDSSPGRDLNALCSWERHFILTVSLSTLVYKWKPAKLILKVTLQWTSIPSRERGTRLCHLRVDVWCWFSPLSEGFSQGSPVFPSLQKPTSPNSNPTRIEDPRENLLRLNWLPH